MGPRNCARVYQTTRCSSTTRMPYFRASGAPHQCATPRGARNYDARSGPSPMRTQPRRPGDAMSAAAEALVTDWLDRYPKVKGCRRDLARLLATLIPEGDTMTPPITVEELAARSGYYEQAIRRARNFLVKVGVVRVTSTRPARYELCALPGAAAPPASFSWRADLREAPRRPPLLPTPLFDAAEGSDAARTSENHRVEPTPTSDYHWLGSGTFHRFAVTIQRWVAEFVTLTGTFHWLGGSAPGEKYRSSPHVLQDEGATTKYQDLDPVVVKTGEGGVARARDATAPDDDATMPDDDATMVDVDPVDMPGADGFLVWFELAYPRYNNGARCHVDSVRDGPLVSALIHRGYARPQLEAMALLLWATTTDGVVNSDRWWIAERVGVRDVRILHRKADYLDLELHRRELVATPQSGGQLRLAHRELDPTAVDNDVWRRTLERIETKVNRHTFYTWFRATVLVRDRGDVVEVAQPGADSATFAAQLRGRFDGVVQEAIAEVRPSTRVEFVVVGEAQRRQA